MKSIIFAVVLVFVLVGCAVNTNPTVAEVNYYKAKKIQYELCNSMGGVCESEKLALKHALSMLPRR